MIKKILLMLFLMISLVSYGQGGYNLNIEHYLEIDNLINNLDISETKRTSDTLVGIKGFNYSYQRTVEKANNIRHIYIKNNKRSERRNDTMIIVSFIKRDNQFDLSYIKGDYLILSEMWMHFFIRTESRYMIENNYKYRDLVNWDLNLIVRLTRSNGIDMIKNVNKP